MAPKEQKMKKSFVKKVGMRTPMHLSFFSLTEINLQIIKFEVFEPLFFDSQKFRFAKKLFTASDAFLGCNF